MRVCRIWLFCLVLLLHPSFALAAKENPCAHTYAIYDSIAHFKTYNGSDLPNTYIISTSPDAEINNFNPAKDKIIVLQRYKDWEEFHPYLCEDKGDTVFLGIHDKLVVLRNITPDQLESRHFQFMDEVQMDFAPYYAPPIP